MNYEFLTSSYVWLIPLVVIISLFDAVMKAIGMWKSARNNHLIWFVCIAVFNTVGILPIVYIILDKNGTLNQNRVDDVE